MPHFQPCPENEFPEFIETYYQRCRAVCPEIEGNAGKWKFEDLIPGLSDFDTRFLTRDGLRADDWNRMSMAVGQVHYDLARERPEWARTLEHLPGVNLSLGELTDPDGYYPEFCQWTFYRAENPALRDAGAAFSTRPWSDADAAYHWKRIALYYDRYNRSIDPPINLGSFEGKYPLHSRYMHYLAPPLHSAVCLMDHRTTPGKLDAFRRAREVFPMPEVMDLVLGGIEQHYETPEWYEEPRLTELDALLECYLCAAIDTVRTRTPGFACPPQPAPAEVRAAVKTLPEAGAMTRFFENIKFARFMKGRLWFYAQELAWFDSLPLIRIELGRIGKNFLTTPLEIFSSQILGRDLPWNTVLEELRSCGFSRQDIAVCRRFHELADPQAPVGEYRIRALQLVDLYSDFLGLLDRVSQLAQEGVAGR